MASTVQEEKECMACGSTERVQGHHVLYDPEFTIPLCASCHMKVRLQGKNYINLEKRHKIGMSLLRQVQKIPYGQRFNFYCSAAIKRGISWREIHYYIEFAERYPDIDDFLSKHPDFTWKEVREQCLQHQNSIYSIRENRTLKVNS